MKEAIKLGSIFIGTKTILATALTRQEYCDYRGWDVPTNEDPTEVVYLVEYLDGGGANDSRHQGYISMSPKEVFEGSYRQNGSLTFGDALVHLKLGRRVARSGWNGKGMWLNQIKSTNYDVGIHSMNGATTLLPYIAMKTVGDELVPWLASQTDMLAEDWYVDFNQ